GDYLCVGRPTVSNPVGEIHPLFKTHKVGLLAKWDAVDFAEKIITLLNHPHIAEQFGRNARQVAENEYDWHILVDKLEKFYCKIASHKEKSDAFQMNKIMM
ncbi:MAG: glycosyltransferase, partial [Anaerolineaceae bacterium]|nr:glycosyltransferase [Anaerolineaceae bacterium]